MMKASYTWVMALGGMLFVSCSSVEFYTQGMRGQVEILQKSRPIPNVLEDPATSPKLRKQLEVVQEIREFATGHLALPGAKSYGKYADLGRPYVSWVVYAVPEFSMRPKTWRYPLVGELNYRGYFQEEDAKAEGRRLKAEGNDVEVGGVDAFSTLGWFHDPVLNCFVESADVDLAELLFHELTHRRYFRSGDTAFNEGLATAYAEEGVRQWLRYHRRFADLQRYEQRLVKRAQFYAEIERTKARLERLYASGLAEAEMRREKTEAMAGLQRDLRELRKRWGGRGLESWLKGKINNAHLISVITYEKECPRFRRLLKECGGGGDGFFERVKDLPGSDRNR